MALSRRHFVLGAGVVALGAGYAAYDWFMKKQAVEKQAVEKQAQPQHADDKPSVSVDTILENDMVLGDPGAPISIVEYASLTCPHCGYFHANAFKMLEEKYIKTGKAHMIYRDFPLDQYAFEASVLAHSLGKEKFFTILKILFAKQAEWRNASNPTEALIEVGKIVGVSRAKFEESLKDEKLGESILTDRMVGSSEYGVASTPTVFINGNKYEGSTEPADLDAFLQGL